MERDVVNYKVPVHGEWDVRCLIPAARTKSTRLFRCRPQLAILTPLLSHPFPSQKGACLSETVAALPKDLTFFPLNSHYALVSPFVSRGRITMTGHTHTHTHTSREYLFHTLNPSPSVFSACNALLPSHPSLWWFDPRDQNGAWSNGVGYCVGWLLWPCSFHLCGQATSLEQNTLPSIMAEGKKKLQLLEILQSCDNLLCFTQPGVL